MRCYSTVLSTTMMVIPTSALAASSTTTKETTAQTTTTLSSSTTFVAHTTTEEASGTQTPNDKWLAALLTILGVFLLLVLILSIVLHTLYKKRVQGWYQKEHRQNELVADSRKLRLTTELLSFDQGGKRSGRNTSNTMQKDLVLRSIGSLAAALASCRSTLTKSIHCA